MIISNVILVDASEVFHIDMIHVKKAKVLSVNILVPELELFAARTAEFQIFRGQAGLVFYL
jgi:hypothetical protein